MVSLCASGIVHSAQIFFLQMSLIGSSAENLFVNFHKGGYLMDLFKSIIEFIVSGAQLVNVDIINALLIFYISVVPVFFLIRIMRGLMRRSVS